MSKIPFLSHSLDRLLKRLLPVPERGVLFKLEGFCLTSFDTRPRYYDGQISCQWAEYASAGITHGSVLEKDNANI